MTPTARNITARARRCRASMLVAIAVAGLVLAGCGGDDTREESSAPTPAATKRIMLQMPFPCGLNEIIAELCAGAEEAGRSLPAGYELEVKTATDIGDNVAFNNLIETSLRLEPAGLIVFPGGPAAQTPVLNKACDRDVEVIVFSATTGVKCQSALVGSDHYKQGADLAKWLVEHPPASKQIGIATQPPGQFVSTDERVRGFKETIEAAGYEVVATVITDLSLDKTRTQVTNMLTAHPNLGTVFSGNGVIGQGVKQALRGRDRVVQLTLDFVPSNIPDIEKGTIDAVARQDTAGIGRRAVETMVKVLQGERVPSTVNVRTMVVDKANAGQADSAFADDE